MVQDVMSMEDATQLKQSIAQLLSTHERYKDTDLTMPAMAAELGLSAHQFSLFINEQLGQNFSQLVNTYRVRAAQQLLLNQPHLTVEAIGFDCGFNSPSTFHTAFKRETGITPAAYRKRAVVSSDL